MDKRKRNSILKKVRTLVEDTHWIKGMYRDWEEGGKETYCLMGAVRHVTAPGHVYDDSKDAEAVRELLLETINGLGYRKRPYESVEEFNDRTRTKRDDILAVIDAALAK